MSSSKQEGLPSDKVSLEELKAFLGLKVSMSSSGRGLIRVRLPSGIYLKSSRSSLEVWEEALEAALLREHKLQKAKISCCH